MNGHLDVLMEIRGSAAEKKLAVKDSSDCNSAVTNVRVVVNPSLSLRQIIK